MLGVRDIVVVGLPAGSADESAVAATVFEAGASITLTDVHQQAEKSTVHYTLPCQIVVMTGLPRSQLGEVTHKKVREQILDTADSILTVASQIRDAVDQMRSAADRVRSTTDSATASTTAKLRSLKNRE